MTKFSLKITEDNQTISNRITKALRDELIPLLTIVFNKCQKEITLLIQSAIISSDTYQSLSGGQLKAEFGLRDSDERLDQILDFWSKIHAKFEKPRVSNGKIVGGFKIQMIQTDFRDVISTSAATYTTNKGDIINWLEWLLLFGNKTIIKDYNVVFGNFKTSRTGMAIMRNSIQGKWSVPTQYAGTIKNNWITRIIDALDDDINNILIKNFKDI